VEESNVSGYKQTAQNNKASKIQMIYYMYVILKCSYCLVIYPEAVSPNMDFWNKIN
jgi:hypothetical protein